MNTPKVNDPIDRYCRTIDVLHDDDGAFRSADDVRWLFAPVDKASGRQVIPYCTIGGRACTLGSP